MARLTQNSFAGGEISPQLWGRTDVARYANSVRVLMNWIPSPYGGARTRSGFQWIVGAKEDQEARLVPFSFSRAQSYLLELGEGYGRVVYRGAQVQADGSPVEFATPWTAEDLPLLRWAQVADVLTVVCPGQPPQEIRRLAHDSWTCTPYAYKNGPWAEPNVDEAVRLTSSAAVGVVTISASKPAFSSGDVGRLLYLEQLSYGQPWVPGQAVSVGDIRRSDGKYYRALAGGTTGTEKPVVDTGTWDDGGVVWAYVHSGWGTALITAVAVDRKSCTATVQHQIPDELLGASFEPAISTEGQALDTDTGYTLVEATHGLSSGETGVARVGTNTGSHSGDYDFEYVDSEHLRVHLPYYLMTGGEHIISLAFPAASATSTWEWRLGAWGGNQGWPTVVSAFQQRMVFAATQAAPHVGWMTRSGSFHDFMHSFPSEDGDPITFPLASGSIDEIQGLLTLDRFAVLTSGAEWVLGAGLEDALTPSNAGAKVRSYWGSSSLPPLLVGSAAIFSQAQGGAVRDLTLEAGNAGGELSTFASHLLDGHRITRWAWHQTPYQTAWCVREDGLLLGLGYNREQQVLAWSRQVTLGAFEDLAVVPEPDEDALYVLVRREIDGTTRRFIEHLAPRKITDVRDAFCVDAGLSFDGRNTRAVQIMLDEGSTWDEEDIVTIYCDDDVFTGDEDLGDQIVFEHEGQTYRLTVVEIWGANAARATPNRFIPEEARDYRTNWAWARNRMTGFAHLEGQTVAILADGNVQEPAVVQDGTVVLERPAVRVHVGLPYVCDLETLDLSIPGVESIIPKAKAVNAVQVLVNEARSLWAGRDADHLQETKLRTSETYDQPINLRTGLLQARIQTSWGQGGQCLFRVQDPLPTTILALFLEVAIGG